MESYILTKSMHLGYLKETFGRGAVIKFDPRNRKLTIEGRQFDDVRDIEILKRQAVKNPDRPWIVQYSDEVLAAIRGELDEPEEAVPRRAPNGEGMPIVQSDEDSHQTIDIRHTQVSRIKKEANEAARNKTRSEDLPVVKGDQSVEERLAELRSAKDTDLSARAERVRLMSARKAELPVVRDDSLGHAGGSKSAALNAGLPVGGRRAEETPEEVRAAAEARKKESEANRQKVAEEIGVDLDQAEIDEVTPMPAPADAPSEGLVEEVSENVESIPVPSSELDKDAEIAALKARLAQLEPGEEVHEAPAAPRKAKKMPVVTKGD